MYILIHTMTVTQTDCVMVAQFVHALNSSPQQSTLHLLARRVRVKIHPHLATNRGKLNFQRTLTPNLKTIVKRKNSHVKHHLRIVAPNRPTEYVQKIEECTNTAPPANVAVLPRCPSDSNILASEEHGIDVNKQSVSLDFSVQQMSHWLVCNRFSNYIQTFTGFTGSDMLRMSKEDLMQICGQADGIRLFNALQSKSIAPKLTMYVCRENSSVYHALYLNAHSSAELCLKLCGIIGVPNDQVRSVYLQGPHGIHVHLNDDVIRHVKEESMFSVDVATDNNAYVVVLKPIVK